MIDCHPHVRPARSCMRRWLGRRCAASSAGASSAWCWTSMPSRARTPSWDASPSGWRWCARARAGRCFVTFTICRAQQQPLTSTTPPRPSRRAAALRGAPDDVQPGVAPQVGRRGDARAGGLHPRRAAANVPSPLPQPRGAPATLLQLFWLRAHGRARVHAAQGYGGLVPGWAGPTGLALLVGARVAHDRCSLALYALPPTTEAIRGSRRAGFVPMALIAMFRRRAARKPGEQRRKLFCFDAFTLFYVSHLFYYAYAVLLILHAQVRRGAQRSAARAHTVVRNAGVATSDDVVTSSCLASRHAAARTELLEVVRRPRHHLVGGPALPALRAQARQRSFARTSCFIHKRSRVFGAAAQLLDEAGARRAASRARHQAGGPRAQPLPLPLRRGALWLLRSV